MKEVWMVHYLICRFDHIVDYFDSVWEDVEDAYSRRDYLEQVNGRTLTWKGSTITKLPFNDTPKYEVTKA